MIAHLALLAALQQQTPAIPANRSYLVFVASAGTDEVALVRFGPSGFYVEHRTPYHLVPGDPATPTEMYSVPHFLFDTLPVVFDSNLLLSSAHGFAPSSLTTGPHHLSIGPDGRSYFVTSNRGLPSGELLSVRIAPDLAAGLQPVDQIQGREPLGTGLGVARISPDGAFAWTTVAAGIGDAPAGVSVVYLSSMIEAAMIPTCPGATGGQLTSDGLRHFSLCPGDNLLVEIDAAKMAVTRKLDLSGGGAERCVPGAMAMTPDGARIYIACRALNRVIEVDGRSWSVTRRLPVGNGPSELSLAPDGWTLIVANSAARSVSLVGLSPGAATAGVVRSIGIGAGAWFAYIKVPGAAGGAPRTDIYEIGPLLLATTFLGSPAAGGTALASVATISSEPTAVAVSSDGKFGFLTATRLLSGSGSIVAIDLATRTVVRVHPFGKSLADIAFWKVSP